MAVLLAALAATAQTTNSLTDAEIQGRNLALQLCEGWPDSSTNTGVLQIRNAQGKRSIVPIKCEVIVGPASWTSIYEAFFTNGTEVLRITHPIDQMESRVGDYPSGKFTGNVNDLDWIGTRSTIEHTYAGQEISNSSFAGSDFSVTDLSLGFFHWPQQVVLKKEVKRSRGCTVLESINPHPSPVSYSRVVTWIDNETLGIVQAQAYDAQGKLLKEFYPKDFKKVKGQWQVGMMDIENVQTGSRTRLIFDLKNG